MGRFIYESSVRAEFDEFSLPGHRHHRARDFMLGLQPLDQRAESGCALSGEPDLLGLRRRERRRGQRNRRQEKKRNRKSAQVEHGETG